MAALKKLARDVGGFAAIVVLLLAVYFLPPDTSLSEIRAAHTIRACVPTAYPPLVTGDPEKPGIDVELLQAIAARIGVELLLSPTEAMGRDFNPRDWDVTRGKCQILAGGVVATPLTRSFLDTSPPYAQTGWVVIAPKPIPELRGHALGALTILSGLDRIRLASYLRGEGARVVVVPGPAELVAAVAAGRVEGGITEALLGSRIAGENGWTVAWLPERLGRYDMVFGLWKGDLTLKRAVGEAIGALTGDGTVAAILARYGVAGNGGRPAASQ